MVRNKNLVNLYTLVQKINRDDIAGDIVECGVWNGGSSACMAFACRADEHHPKQRTSWLFDSFQGLPPTSDKDGTREQVFCLEGLNKGSQHKVQQVFRELGLSLDNVNIVPGWFDVTVPSAPIEKIALLHIDADWYESVKLVLDTLYDKVEPGGFVVLDDYNYWEGCNRALEDFFTERNLSHSILANPNRSGVYFQKPTS
jgi:O-methyltransferase